MTPIRTFALAVAAVIFVVDQAIKWLVLVPLRLREVGQIELIEIFNLTYVENRGISLGLLAADSPVERWGLTALTALIATGVGIWMLRERNRQDVFGLALVFGGALGNIVDRVRFGYVVDYADLHFGDFRPFLVFNVADAAITIGVLILLARALLVREPPKV